MDTNKPPTGPVRSRPILLMAAGLVLFNLALGVIILKGRKHEASSTEPARRCGECHLKADDAWIQSHQPVPPCPLAKHAQDLSNSPGITNR